jgi:membrane peptidoglycan carboxypeptidase
MLQGVLARGTARSISGLAPYVAGKTGTSDNENDAWFIGFTNDVTVAVWIGYDNSDGKRRTLGGGATGGHVAVPIFEPVIQAAWSNVAPKTALAPPSPEAKRHLACKSIDLDSGEMQVSSGRPITECFRIDRSGQIIDTQHQLISRGDAYGAREFYGVAPGPYGYGNYEQRGGYYYYDNNGRYVPAPRDPWRQPGQYYYGQFGPYGRDPRFQAQPPRDPYGREYQTPQRIDPGYIWGNRRYY